MSSAILYLAIVAIWAIVLVPRWLRQPHPDSASTGADLDEAAFDDGSLDEAAIGEHGPAGGVTAGSAGLDEAVPTGQTASAEAARMGAAAVVGREGPLGVAPGRAVATESHGRHPRPRAENPAPGQERAASDARGGTRPSPASRRAHILQARRRTLVMLVLLTAGAAAIAVAHLAASWVSIPPAVLLVFFLLLLRTAARVDAQRAYEARVRVDHAEARERPGTGSPEASDAVDSPMASQDADETAVSAPAQTAGGASASAEIIDLSPGVEDQPYDQYLDAEARAVGD